LNLQSDSIDRLSFFLFKNVNSSINDDERSILINTALNHFLDKPIQGFGIGYTTVWSSINQQGTHNMLLMHLVEFGILGLLIMPVLSLVLLTSNNNISKKQRIIYLLIFLFGSLFSHNYFDSMTSFFIITILFYI
jgi:O-antigen ligase